MLGIVLLGAQQYVFLYVVQISELHQTNIMKFIQFFLMEHSLTIPQQEMGRFPHFSLRLDQENMFQERSWLI
jgi:hypothetical protein